MSRLYRSTLQQNSAGVSPSATNNANSGRRPSFHAPPLDPPTRQDAYYRAPRSPLSCSVELCAISAARHSLHLQWSRLRCSLEINAYKWLYYDTIRFLCHNQQNQSWSLTIKHCGPSAAQRVKLRTECGSNFVCQHTPVTTKPRSWPDEPTLMV